MEGFGSDYLIELNAKRGTQNALYYLLRFVMRVQRSAFSVQRYKFSATFAL